MAERRAAGDCASGPRRGNHAVPPRNVGSLGPRRRARRDAGRGRHEPRCRGGGAARRPAPGRWGGGGARGVWGAERGKPPVSRRPGGVPLCRSPRPVRVGGGPSGGADSAPALPGARGVVSRGPRERPPIRARDGHGGKVPGRRPRWGPAGHQLLDRPATPTGAGVRGPPSGLAKGRHLRPAVAGVRQGVSRRSALSSLRASWWRTVASTRKLAAKDEWEWSGAIPPPHKGPLRGHASWLGHRTPVRTSARGGVGRAPGKSASPGVSGCRSGAPRAVAARTRGQAGRDVRPWAQGGTDALGGASGSAATLCAIRARDGARDARDAPRVGRSRNSSGTARPIPTRS